MQTFLKAEAARPGGKKPKISLPQVPDPESKGNSILDPPVLPPVRSMCLCMHLQVTSAASERIMLKIGTMYLEKK